MRMLKPIGIICAAWIPPDGSASSLVTAPSLASAVVASAPSVRSVPIARTSMRRIRSSERWLHGPCATRLPYKRSRRVVPVRVQGRALYRAGHLRSSDREQQEEGDEDQDGGADERCQVTREVADQDPRDHGTDRLSQRPDAGPQPGHLGCTL